MLSAGVPVHVNLYTALSERPLSTPRSRCVVEGLKGCQCHHHAPQSDTLHDHSATCARSQTGCRRARDHAALSGAPRPPSIRVVARLLSAVDFRPAVLALLDARFPPDVRETAAAALRVAELGPAAAFANITLAGALQDPYSQYPLWLGLDSLQF